MIQCDFCRTRHDDDVIAATTGYRMTLTQGGILDSAVLPNSD